MTVHSFSGAHPFRPQCLLGAFDDGDGSMAAGVARLVVGIDAGRCPRCSGPLPTPPTLPSGSRLTRCRCIPICNPCGDHEGIPRSDLARVLDVDEEDLGWFIEPDERDEQRAAFYAAHPPTVGLVADGVVVTEDGAFSPQPRPHPGGWAEFGFDDSADEDERSR